MAPKMCGSKSEWPRQHYLTVGIDVDVLDVLDVHEGIDGATAIKLMRKVNITRK
jgi:hypothetical protein